MQNSFVIQTTNLHSITRDFKQPFSDDDFAPAKRAVAVDPKRFEFHVSEVAKSVYFIESASPDYNCMFVVFADYVLVVEAPSSDSASTKVMAAIREVAPGKEIRYIVPTHFHEDHIGGLRAYLRAGATVVTTPGNLGFMEILMKKMRASDPQIKLAPVEVMGERRRFSDATVTLDLLNIPSPHVDEMIVPFLPVGGIAYVADGFTRDFGPARPATAEERILAKHFNQLGLDIKVILPGHGPASVKADFDLSKALTVPRKRQGAQ